jgi:hypothetical protein
VGECWVVIFFAVKVEVDRLTVEVEGRGGSTEVKMKSKVDRNKSKVEVSRLGKVEVEGRGGSTW